VVLIRCPECGANTGLAAAYYNVEDTEVRCSGCKAKLTVTLKNGEIKKIETKGPGIGQVRFGDSSRGVICVLLS
jgi:hypothetical protein